MQVQESYPLSQVSSTHFLMDEIYAPDLNGSRPAPQKASPTAADLKAQRHSQAITELHRFLESSCDCV